MAANDGSTCNVHGTRQRFWGIYLGIDGASPYGWGICICGNCVTVHNRAITYTPRCECDGCKRTHETLRWLRSIHADGQVMCAPAATFPLGQLREVCRPRTQPTGWLRTSDLVTFAQILAIDLGADVVAARARALEHLAHNAEM